MSEGNNFDDNIKELIKNELREKASPRHVPAVIIEAPDIPYTFSGKKVESAVTNILHRRKVTNRGAMRNPECLEFYEAIKSELS
jgi:acetoacetyl-CoA synthetase